MLIEESKHRPTKPSLSWGQIMYVYLINDNIIVWKPLPTGKRLLLRILDTGYLIVSKD